MKTLANLIEKAEKKGEAVLNGRMYNESIRGYEELREKYAIEIENNILTLRHWGTETLKIDLAKREVLNWYGESNSDRDSMNYILNYYDIKGFFKYRPSLNEFSYNM